jgi:SAM-dependent methyltransferase
MASENRMKDLVRRLRRSDPSTERQRAEHLWSTLHERKPGWEQLYQDSWQWPHRPLVVETIRSLGPYESMLELGCNAGQNIIALHRGVGGAEPLTKPYPRITGIDINDVALNLGRKYFAEQSWTHVDVRRGVFPEALESIPDRSFDLVFAIAVLMHIAPGACEATVHQALRIARRRLVLMDLHTFQPFMKQRSTASPYQALRDRWERDWWTLIPRPDWHVEIREMPPEVNKAAEGDVNAVIVATRRA